MAPNDSSTDEMETIDAQRNQERQELRDQDRQRKERDAKRQASLAQTRGIATAAQGSAGGALTSTISAQILQKMWLACFTGVGALIGIPYINLHFVIYYLGGPFSRFFCAPGEEWNIGALAAAKTPGSASPLFAFIGYVELIAIAVIDVLLFMTIMVGTGLTAIIVYAYLHPIKMFIALWSEGFSMVWHYITGN